MNTKHLVDPEIAPLIDQSPTLQFTLETLPQVRAFGAELFEHQKALQTFTRDFLDALRRAFRRG